MSLLVPHAPQCVHKNLHKSGRKCQYTQSMVIRQSQKHLCFIYVCDVELAESSFSVQLMVNHRSSGMITLCMYKITPDFLWPGCMKEKLWSSGESEPEELGPSCSWQDSGSFLCLSRKCTKSDYTFFHLPAYRTGNPVSHYLVGLLVHRLQISQFIFACVCLKFHAQTYSI